MRTGQRLAEPCGDDSAGVGSVVPGGEDGRHVDGHGVAVGRAAFLVAVGRCRQDRPLREGSELFQELVGARGPGGRAPGQHPQEEGRDPVICFAVKPGVKLAYEVIGAGMQGWERMAC
jgi:hypothetical protein